MHSSISSSESVAVASRQSPGVLAVEAHAEEQALRPCKSGPTRSTWVLLAMTIALLVATEFVSRVGLERISRIHQRIMGEARHAEQIRPATAGSPKTMLIVGNSLLLRGVNLPALVDHAAPQFQVSRYVVDNTFWYDWYYGLRSLFRHGARPDYLVICLADLHFVSDNSRGDFVARFLFDAVDLWPFSRDLHLDMSATSSLYVANASSFYGARSELRQVLMGKIFPAVPTLLGKLAVTPAPKMTEENMSRIAIPRLKKLRELCERYRTKCVILIVPTLTDPSHAIERAGEAEQIPVRRPIPNSALAPSFYRDGFHLTDEGADLFTSAIAADLVNW